jgi:signal transduction histidine kinase
MKALSTSGCNRWWPALLAALWLVAPAAEELPLWEAGYAVFDPPEVRRSFVSGAVNALARTPDGLLFVGSNRLTVFDGHNWRRIDVPGTSRFLSLAAEALPAQGVRVWFGSDGALGYVDRTSTGDWSLTSLAGPLAAAGLTDLSDIRHARPDGRGGAIFVTRAQVLHWDGRQFTIWPLPNPPRSFTFEYRGAVHVYQDGVGLLRVSDQGPHVWLAETDLPERQPITGLVELPGDEALVLFFNDEIYRRGAQGQWTHLSDLSRIVRGRRALHAARVGPDTIAIGFAYGGVLLCRNNGSLISLVNTQSGLPDDNTDALLDDGEGGLWIGTGTGLTRLIGAGRASLFDQRARIANGVIRRVLEHEGRPFVVTSRRAYDLVPTPPTEPARFNRLEIIWPQLRDGVVRRGRLWLGGSGGLWNVTGGTAVHDPAVTADIFQLLAPSWLPEGMIYLDRTQIYALLPAGKDSWQSVTLNQQIESLPVSILEDSAGRLWVSTRDGHVYIYTWDKAARALHQAFHHAPGNGGLPANLQRPQLARLGNSVALFTDTDILVSADPAAGFAAASALADFSADAAVPLPDGAALWSVQFRPAGDAAPHALIRVSRDQASGRLTWEPFAAPGLDHISDVTSLSLTGPRGSEVLWVGGETALLRLELPAASPPRVVPPVHLSEVTADANREPTDPAVFPVKFAAKVSRLQFSFAAIVSDPSLLFQSRLVGVEDTWSSPSPSPQREFTGLASGTYDFQVRAVDRFGRAGPATAFPFQLEAPWYRRPLALAIWILLLAAAARGAMKWRLRRLKQQATRLEQLVNERTRELSLSNTARSEFLDSLSHELRRPLNGILSLIRRLEESSLSTRQREHAQLLRQGTESLARVCDEVLNFSALEYGAVALEERPFLLGEMLARAISEFGGGGTRPTVRLPADWVDGFVGDEAKLRTVVGNFLANASKHAADSLIEIVVSSAATPDGRANVLIEVVDGGPGIPVEEQELIFKRFVRGSQAKQARVPGTGIGLATCRAMTRLMGGSVGVESPSERAREHGWPGAGSTFFVRVPLRRSVLVPA